VGIAQLRVPRRRRGGTIPALLSGPILSIGRPSPDAPLRRGRVTSRRCSIPIYSAVRPSELGSVLLEAGNQVGSDRGESGLLQQTEPRGRLISRPDLGGKGGETAAQPPDRVSQSDKGDFPGRVPDDGRHGGKHLLEPPSNTLRQGLPALSPAHMAQGGRLHHDERRRVATPTWRRTKTRGLTGRVGTRRTSTGRPRVRGVQVVMATAGTARRTSAASAGTRNSGALSAPTTIEDGGCLVHRVPPTWGGRRRWPTPVGVGVVAPSKALAEAKFAVLEPLITMGEAPSIGLLPRCHPLTTVMNDRRPPINLIVEGEHALQDSGCVPFTPRREFCGAQRPNGRHQAGRLVPESAPVAYDGVPRRRHSDQPVGSEDGKRTVQVITGLEGRGEVRHVPRHTRREAKRHLYIQVPRRQRRIAARANVLVNFTCTAHKR